VEDPGGGGQVARGLEDRPDVGDVRRAAEPPGAVAELLQELGRLAGALLAEGAVAGPDADGADVHGSSVAGPMTTERRAAAGAAKASSRSPSSMNSSPSSSGSSGEMWSVAS